MVLRDIHTIFESWAPRELAWERDSTGLQVGSMRRNVRKILTALDVTDEVVEEARRKNVDLIISHHPLLFHPVRSVNTDERVGRIVERLAARGIALYAAHTNLDFTREGVSSALAERLGIQNLDVLRKDQRIDKKIVVFVPLEYAEKVVSAMAGAGAGRIGNYERCSFRVEGTGAFTPSRGARPFTGKPGRERLVDEVRLEMALPAWSVERVIAAMRSAHPYEEVAYDLYDLSNASNWYGAGVIGELKREMTLGKFLGRVRQTLNAAGIRYTGDPKRSIRRVAACGGSGSDLLPVAISRGADVFLTADVTYHTFQECDGRIALIDAGHFETEQPIVPRIIARLKAHPMVRKNKVQVLPSTSTRNFISYKWS